MSTTIVAVFSAKAAVLETEPKVESETAGLSSLFTGHEIEHPGIQEALLTHGHEQLPDGEQAEFVRALGLPLSALLNLCQVNFRPTKDWEIAAVSPVTEVARFYFQSNPGEDILTGFLAFRDILYENKVAGFSGFAVGLSHETVKHEGYDAYVAVLLMGWTTIAAHEAFQQTRLFKDSLHVLPIGQASDIEQHHTAFRPVLPAQGDNSQHCADA